VNQDERILRLRDRDVAGCVQHPRYAGRQARHVRIDVLVPVFLSLLERPRLIGHLAVCRIDNPGRPGIDVTVAGMLLDVLDTAALAPPESLHVRLTVGSPRRRERSCLGERAGMERDGITRTIVWSRRWAATLRVDDHRGGGHERNNEPDDVFEHD